MPKEEWGTKRLCPHCATRFYDLRNDPLTCPACGNQFSLESFNEGRGKALTSEKTATQRNTKTNDEEEDLEDEGGDLDDDLLDDDDDDGDVSLDEIADAADDDED